MRKINFLELNSLLPQTTINLQKLKNSIIRHGFFENIEDFQLQKQEQKKIIQIAESFLQILDKNDMLQSYFMKFFRSKEQLFQLLNRCQYRTTTLQMLEMLNSIYQDQPKQIDTYFDQISFQISQNTKETELETLPKPSNRFTSSLLEMPTCKEYIQKNSYVEAKGSYLFGSFDSQKNFYTSMRKKSNVDAKPFSYLNQKQRIQNKDTSKQEQQVQIQQKQNIELLNLLQQARRKLNLCNKEFENQISFQRQEIKSLKNQLNEPEYEINSQNKILQDTNFKTQVQAQQDDHPDSHKNIKLLCQQFKKHLNSTPEIEVLNLEYKVNIPKNNSLKSKSEQKISLVDRFPKIQVEKDMLSIDYQQKKKKNYPLRHFDIITNEKKN